MQFRAATPAGIIDASNTVELWDGERLAAVIHASRSGIHIVCETGYAPAAGGLAIEAQRPYGIQIGLTRD
jgi:hypothetical protein